MDSTNISNFSQLHTPKVETPFDPDKALNESWIDPTAPISDPLTALQIDSGRVAPACTLGNFSLVIGKAKSRKTFLITAALAAAAGTKVLCLTGSLPAGSVILFFDTEQSQYHAARTIQRVCRLIGDSNPVNFKGYGLRRYKPAERLAIIEGAIYNTEKVSFVAIDGIRDLLTRGINDEEEATSLTSSFLRWTAEKDIHLMLALHQNKGDLNARGHIGTEAVNKAETVLSVTKFAESSDISIVEAEYSRDVDFEPFSFLINAEGLPELCDLPQTEKAVKKSQNPEYINDQEHFTVLANIYRKNSEPLFTELRDGIIYGFHGAFGQNKVRTFISHYLDKGWLKKERNGMRVIYKYTRALF